MIEFLYMIMFSKLAIKNKYSKLLQNQYLKDWPKVTTEPSLPMVRQVQEKRIQFLDPLARMKDLFLDLLDIFLEILDKEWMFPCLSFKYIKKNLLISWNKAKAKWKLRRMALELLYKVLQNWAWIAMKKPWRPLTILWRIEESLVPNSTKKAQEVILS